MVSPLECIRFKAANQDVAEEYIEELDGIINALRGQDAALSDVQLAEKALGIVEFRLKQRRRWASLVTEKAQNVLERAARGGDDPAKVARALDSVFMNDPGREFADLPSFESVAATETNRGVNMLFSVLRGARSKMLGAVRNRAGIERTVREVLGEDTGDPIAKSWAEAWRKTDEYFVRRRQYFGSPVVKRENWFPQTHNPVEIGRAGKDEWVNFIWSRLDREKMIDLETDAPMTDARLKEVLDEVYETLRTNGNNKRQPGRGLKPYGYVTRAENSRFLQFKSADAFLEYDREFGSGGDLFSLMVGHIQHMGREVATLKLLGPEPSKTLNVMKDTLAQAGASEAAINRIDWAFDDVTGRSNIPVRPALAAVGQATRNILTGTLLGKAVVTAVPGDLATMRMAAQFNGLPAWKAWTQAFKHLTSQVRGDRDAMMELGANLLLGAESYMHTALGMQRFLGEFEGPRATRVYADVMMRATGLTPWTQAGRQAFGTMYLGQLASHAKRFSFDELASKKPKLYEAMQAYGITAEDWAKFGESRFHRQQGGGSYLDADRMFQEGEEALGQKLMQAVLTEQDRGVIASTARSQVTTRQGQKPGSVVGELWRAMTQFYQFPISFAQQYYTATYRNPAFSTGRKAAHMADAVVTMTIAGAIAQQANELIRGRDPDPRMWSIDPDDPESFRRAGGFWADALARGGGLSIFGDYLTRDLGSWGTLGNLAIGPMGGAVRDVYGVTNLYELAAGEETSFGADVTDFARRYTPLANSWMASLAANRLIWDRLQQQLDPEAYARFNRDMRKRLRERGQADWWAPGETEPARPPQIEAQ